MNLPPPLSPQLLTLLELCTYDSALDPKKVGDLAARERRLISELHRYNQVMLAELINIIVKMTPPTPEANALLQHLYKTQTAIPALPSMLIRPLTPQLKEFLIQWIDQLPPIPRFPVPSSPTSSSSPSSPSPSPSSPPPPSPPPSTPSTPSPSASSSTSSQPSSSSTPSSSS